jgi:hypothetical protein
MVTNSRYIGCLAGLAVGDALGAILEFKSWEPAGSPGRTWLSIGYCNETALKRSVFEL